MSRNLTQTFFQNDDSIGKASEIANNVINELQQLCQCNLAANVINNGGFICFMQSPQYVTYRAKIQGTTNVAALELISYIEQWVTSGAILNVRAQFLNLQPFCTVPITSADEGECEIPSQSTSELPMISTSTSISTETNGSSEYNTTVIAIIIAVVCIVIIISTTLIIAIVFVRLRPNVSQKKDLKQDM